MRRIAFLLGTVVMAQLASAAVINFTGTANGTYDGSTSNRDVDDVVVTASDGQSYGFRSYTSGNANTGTYIDTGRIANLLNSQKLYMRDTTGDLFALFSVDAQRRISGQTTDILITGFKADNSTVTHTILVNSDALTTFALPATFTGLKEVRFDLAGGAYTNRAFYDNINVVVPEPAALGVLGMSAAALLIRRRKA